MGVVHLVHDSERDARVALKTLTHEDPLLRTRLKSEFRSRLDLPHPNLVQLFDLHADGDSVYFTMEYIDGADILRWMRGPLLGPDPTLKPGEHAAGDAEDEGEPGPRADPTRVSDALGQVLRALTVLHAHGQAHCDLKPANILVDRSDRVVLLDFGMARGAHSRVSEGISGTPLYMSPEQVQGASAGPATDIYSLGVLLYEALAGARPFPGSPMASMRARLAGAPPRLPDGPYSELVYRMMQVDPSARPTAQQLLRELAWTAPSSGPPFVGRQDALLRLQEASRSDGDGPRVLCIHGPSGIGKSTLLRRFFSHRFNDRLVLTSRCHPTESLPWKAFDGIVDGLAELPADQFHPPPDAGLLARLFPTLGIARTPHDGRPAELRDRAFRALLAWLRQLGRRHSLVLVIDDLQWTDPDSLPLLQRLIGEDEGPAGLILLVHRPDLPDDVAALVSECEQLELGPLETEDVLALSRAEGLGLSLEQAEAVTAATGGHPILLAELATREGGVDLSTVLRERAASVSQSSRDLLSAVVAALGPLPPATALKASEAPNSALTELLQRRLVRWTRGPALEPFHDKVREVLSTQLVVPSTHRQLANALDGPAAWLAHHWSEAGDRPRAALASATAGDEAFSSMAWSTAVDFYARAAEYEETPALSRKLGEALAAAGQPVRAAHAFLRAGEQRDHVQAAELRFGVGDVHGGRELVVPILRNAGMRLAQTQFQALVRLLWWRLCTRLRGLEFTTRGAGECPADLALRVNTAHVVAGALGRIDTLAGMSLHGQGTWLALESGVPEWAVRALEQEAVYSAATNLEESWVARLDARSDELAVTGAPTRCYRAMCRAYRAFTRGEIADALPGFRRVLDLQQTLAVAPWERSFAELHYLWSARLAGDFDALRAGSAALLRRDDGDLTTRVETLIGHAAFVALLDDDPARAESLLVEAATSWPGTLPINHAYLLVHARMHIATYRGEDPGPLLKRTKSAWRPLRRVMHVRIEVPWFSGRATPKALKKERHPWPDAMAAWLEGRPTDCAEGFQMLGMADRALAAAGNLQALEARGVRNPGAWRQMLFPSG